MGVKWRLKCRIWAVLAIIQVVYGHEMYTISQLSPKSAHNEKSPQDVLRTEPENLAFRIEPSLKLEEDLTPVEASRNPRSINTDEIALNNNEIDNEVVHNKRKYYDITPTKTIDYYKDDAAILLSSGFGDKLDFKFPGEAKRAPKGRALTPSEPKVRATVQPILREEGRQNTEIQNIITGIVKLLNGNVNVQANSQLLNGRPRPMASRINNRGPPRISEVPLPEFDTVTHSFVPTKTPPPYPFERPPVEQIPPRPFHRPIPPWQRRPRPPNRRPNPGLPIYKPPILEEKPDIENIIPIEFTTEKNVTDTTTEFTTTKTIEKSTEALIEKTTDVLETTSKKAIEVTEATTVKATTEKPKEIINLTENTDKDEVIDKKDVTDKKEVTNKKVVTDKKELSGKKEVSDKIEVTDIKEVSDKKEMSDKKEVTDKEIKHDFHVIQPSITEVSVEATSTTSTEALSGTTLGVTTKTDAVIEKTSINTQPIATSQGIPYQPYRPRPGIVLDDTDFKPHGTRHRDAPVITAPEHLPGYGEIFDVTVSAIQGPGEKGSVHIENINIHNDDIIVSPSGEQGFVSIDGKRTYLNLFDTSTSISPTRVQEQQTVTVPPQTATPLGTGVAVPADDVQAPIRRPVHRPQTFRRPQPTVRIDTCIVGDDSTCDQAQNEKCRTEAGISSCQCRPGYARRIHRDPCRRVVSLLMDLRVDRLYDRKVTWDIKLMDKDSEPYQQLSYEAVRAIDSAFSMTPFSDDFVSGSVNAIHKGEENQVFVNYTILMQETGETLRAAVATDIQKHILGVIRRRSNNVGTSALWVDSPAGSVLPLKDVDECSSPELNDCHKLASCTNTWGAFKCTCPETTLDPAVTITRSGRDCRECSSSHCNERGVCRYNNGQPYCSCSSGYYGSSCEVDGEVVGVAVGASLAAALVIALTLAALTAWSRKWSREQKAMGMGSPVFNYMTANTVKTPPVGQPPYQVTLEERMRWAQIAEAMAQANHYAQPDPVQMATRPSSAMFGYPTLPPVPLPRMGLHGTMNTVNSRINSASHHNLYGYTNHMASESSSDASSHVQDRADLLVPRPKSRARSMHNQTGIYYDVDYENAPEPIYGSKGIPLSTYTVSRGPPFYR